MLHVILLFLPWSEFPRKPGCSGGHGPRRLEEKLDIAAQMIEAVGGSFRPASRFGQSDRQNWSFLVADASF
jgi:hypothetical protein